MMIVTFYDFISSLFPATVGGSQNGQDTNKDVDCVHVNPNGSVEKKR